MLDGNFTDRPTSFRRFGIGYEQDIKVVLHIISCESRTMEWSSPDDSGVFRIHETGVDMSGEDLDLYCRSDWSAEMAALRQQAAR